MHVYGYRVFVATRCSDSEINSKSNMLDFNMCFQIKKKTKNKNHPQVICQVMNTLIIIIINKQTTDKPFIQVLQLVQPNLPIQKQ